MKTDIQTEMKLPFYTLMLMISFASVNAVLFTPALPSIATFFAITSATAQQTIIWFLVGYALGQLMYGPLANRFGRKPALYMGVSLQIISGFMCIAAGILHEYSLMVIGRFFLALGSSVGLTMTFTLVNECYTQKVASQKISYLMMVFAITPGLGVALGGILNEHYGWRSCFYVGIGYGFILLLLLTRLPETKKIIDLDALKIKNLLQGYRCQFKNSKLILGGMLMGLVASFIYVFASLAPFIAIKLLGMSSAEYGIANILPPIGLLLGSLVSANLANKYPLKQIIKAGVIIASIGSILMTVTIEIHLGSLLAIFTPMMLIYFGLSLIVANTSAIAMSHVHDKAHGSAVMNFLNVGLATVMVLILGVFSISTLLLPSVFIALCVVMIGVYKLLVK
jgi:DHA1 family bicyclomycin/chloramphenicol resistance-like MFS transporter